MMTPGALRANDERLAAQLTQEQRETAARELAALNEELREAGARSIYSKPDRAYLLGDETSENRARAGDPRDCGRGTDDRNG